MARTAAAGCWSRGPRSGADASRRCLAARRPLRSLLVMRWPDRMPSLRWPQAAARPIRSRARRRSRPAGGYARLVIKLAEDVRIRGDHGRLHPRHPLQAPGRHSRRCDLPKRRPIMSARRGAIPTAGRSGCRWRAGCTINTMAAGERMFVDLLPDSWTGPPPSLPHRSDHANWPSGRARPSARLRASSAPRRAQRSGRRSACARWCSRPSCASCSKCPTASASPRCSTSRS